MFTNPKTKLQEQIKIDSYRENSMVPIIEEPPKPKNIFSKYKFFMFFSLCFHVLLSISIFIKVKSIITFLISFSSIFSLTILYALIIFFILKHCADDNAPATYVLGSFIWPLIIPILISYRLLVFIPLFIYNRIKFVKNIFGMIGSRIGRLLEKCDQEVKKEIEESLK